MRKLAISFVLGLVAVVSALQTPAQSAVPVTLIKAGRLLDPRTGNILAPAAVLIEGGKIKEVGSPSSVQAHASAGAKTIDLGSATLLPGLIDSHAHLLISVVSQPEAERARRYNGGFVTDLLLAIVESPSKRVLLGAQMAREDLESGITTVRILGHSGIDGDVACGMRSMLDVWWDQGFLRRDANLRSKRKMDTSRISIPRWPRPSCNRNFCRSTARIARDRP
jgi:hypothetical protein